MRCHLPSLTLWPLMVSMNIKKAMLEKSGCQGKRSARFGSLILVIRIVNNTTGSQTLFCWRYFCFESRVSVKCHSFSHFFFLHQIFKCLTEKFPSNTPDLQHSERRGSLCPGFSVVCVLVWDSIHTSSIREYLFSASCFASPEEK